jgi:prefoldin subunit 5
MYTFRPDASRVFVDVGFQFYLEMTRKEALKFLDEKEKHLNK